MNQPLIWISAGAFMLGLAMAGSEGAWFPWVNFIGVAAVWVSLVALERLAR